MGPWYWLMWQGQYLWPSLITWVSFFRALKKEVMHTAYCLHGEMPYGWSVKNHWHLTFDHSIWPQLWCADAMPVYTTSCNACSLCLSHTIGHYGTKEKAGSHRQMIMTRGTLTCLLSDTNWFVLRLPSVTSLDTKKKLIHQWLTCSFILKNWTDEI